MVAHQAPHGIPTIDHALAGNPHGWTPGDLTYADEDRTRFTAAFEAVQPKLLLHGHYHFPVDEPVDRGWGTSHIFGLAADGEPCAMGELDTGTLAARFISGDSR